jgi:hypothetical protein
MSIDSARIICTGCDYEASEVYRPIRIRYLYSNGQTVETGRIKGWCYNCASYSDIEKINQGDLYEELNSRERKKFEICQRQQGLNRGILSNFRHRTKKRQLQERLKWLDKEIAELRNLLEIAMGRKSNARCLKCWSDKTVPLRFDSESNIASNFKHKCGGNLQIVHDQSGPRFNFRVKTYILNEEGEFLGEE